MNFAKNLFLLLVSPSNGWNEIKKFKVPKDIMLAKVFYPIIAVVAISSFAKYFYDPGHALAYYIQNSVICIVKYFFGYLTANYLLCSLYPNLSDDTINSNRLNTFIIYIYSLLAIIGVLNNILNNFVFFEILPLYIIFIVWQGISYLKIETSVPKFVIIASLAILVPPVLIRVILNFFLSINS